MSSFAYIDASAFIKLFNEEPESKAMTQAIDEDGLIAASEILTVEAFRTAVRIGGEAPSEVPRLLRRVALHPLSRDVRERAHRIGRPALRTLDAIHLATALSLGDEVGAIFTYDKRLAEASADAGLRVLSPA
jgi:uncharacterized protein